MTYKQQEISHANRSDHSRAYPHRQGNRQPPVEVVKSGYTGVIDSALNLVGQGLTICNLDQT